MKVLSVDSRNDEDGGRECLAVCIERLETRRLLTLATLAESPIWTDVAGEAFEVEPWPEDVVAELALSGSGVPILQSNPDAAKKIFLDFDGHTVRNTDWNVFNNDAPIHAPPFSLDNQIFAYSDVEMQAMIEIWQRVAEDFAPFDVDVTTRDPGAAVLDRGRLGLRVMISTSIDDTRVGGTGFEWFAAGGVAYVNSWNYGSDTPVWVFTNYLGTVKSMAEAATHETGHAMGLHHDGQGNVEYYPGHGSGPTGWAPIMGVAYNRNLSQWSRGEYPGATNSEDDLAILRQKLSLRTDDHGDAPTLSSATPLNLSAIDAFGIIETSGDRDVFSLELPSEADVTLDFLPADVGPNLDIEVVLFDANGRELDTVNPSTRLDASLVTRLEAGTYFVSVDGVGAGTLTNGYSDYGSLGQFRIQGDVELDPLYDPGTYYFSLDKPGTITNPDGSRVPFDDSDILELEIPVAGAPVVSMWFDGSDVGLTENSEDIDAFAILPGGRLLVSTSGSAFVRGIDASRADVLMFTGTRYGTRTTGDWEVYLDGSDVGLDRASENIEGLAVFDDGRLLVTTRGRFASGDEVASGQDALLFTPTPGGTGANSSGNWRVWLDGSEQELKAGGERLDALHLTSSGTFTASTRGRFRSRFDAGANEDVFSPLRRGTTLRLDKLGLRRYNIDGFSQADAPAFLLAAPAIPRTPELDTHPSVSASPADAPEVAFVLSTAAPEFQWFSADDDPENAPDELL